MTGIAERIEIPNPLGNQAERRPEWAPYRAGIEKSESVGGSRVSGLGVLGAFLVFSGITVAIAKGNAGLAESYSISPESLLGFAWLIQGAAALICFVLAVRWLRS